MSHYDKKKDKKDKKDKKQARDDKVLKQIMTLENKLQALKTKYRRGDSAEQPNQPADETSDKWEIKLFGKTIQCDKDVRVKVGPVIGKVTSTTAIVLLEVSLAGQVTVHLIPRNNPDASVGSATLQMPKNRPRAFLVENLTPSVTYDVIFEGINAKDARKRTGVVKTLPSHIERLRVVAVSCDRPERQKEGETNMWEQLAKQIQNDEVDVILHLGSSKMTRWT